MQAVFAPRAVKSDVPRKATRGRHFPSHVAASAPAPRHQPASPARDETKRAVSNKLKVAGLAALAAAVVTGTTSPSALANGSQSAPNGAVIAGKARVVDGDTLVIGNERIRLYGVDAPESKQICKLRGADWACGKAAAEALQKELDRVGGSNVKCTVVNGDMYGREVAKCQAANGEEINGWMVSNGWALAYRQYSKEFVPLEEKARAKGAGVWQSEFQPPWEWRKENRASLSTNRPAPQQVAMQAPPPPQAAAAPPPAKKEAVPPAPAPAGCNIKGNIGSKGDKVYHIPGGKFYDQTVINEKQGERYFCSEDEAIAAGWRPASE